MKNIKTKKMTKRQYLFFYIDMCLFTFLFLFLTQVLFAPYGSSDLKDFKLYLCLLNAMGTTTWLHWCHLKLIVKLIRNRESYPDGLDTKKLNRRQYIWSFI